MAQRRLFVPDGRLWLLALACLTSAGGMARMARGDQPQSKMTPAERGYHWLTTKAFLPADFDQETFDNLWKIWPADLRDRAGKATPAERRRMAFSRYGLMERADGDGPGVDGNGPALGYLSDGGGGWV